MTERTGSPSLDPPATPAWEGGEQNEWTAIVLAGRRPGGDPFAESEGVAYKGQIVIAGEAMLGRVLHMLLTAPAVARIVVLAQEPDMLLTGGLAWATAHPRIVARTSRDGISASIAAVAGSADAPWPVLVTTADHPLLEAATVIDFVARAAGADVAVGMVERAVLLARYPESERTWLRLRDGAWSGANLFALGGPAARPALDLWAGVERDRKSAWKLFRAFGVPLFVRALTRTIGLGDALATAGRGLGLVARLVPLRQAEAAIDVDKPADLTLARAILAVCEGQV